MDAQSLAFLLVLSAIVLLLVLVLRRLVWWYWGIDKHLANQREIIDTLKAQIELQQVIAEQDARRRTISKTDVPFGQSRNQ